MSSEVAVPASRQLAPRVPAAGRVGQGTAVEQSRAVAEVEAAIVVALRHPRNIDTATAEMQRSGGQRSLAEKAFFRYSRGGGQISGPSVQLARELARCFGNVQYGLTEMRRDDEYGQSEMQAWCWDVQANTRSSTTFIVPHIRDTKEGPKQLSDMRDIYENNANMGARRLREMIFAILPGWFTEDAVEACNATLRGDDEDLPERVQNCIRGFRNMGVTERQLAQKIGYPVAKWTGYDLATLTVIYRSLQRSETRAEDEFEADRSGGDLSGADIVGRPAEPAAAKPADAPAAPPAAAPAAEPEKPKRGGTGAAQLGHEIAQLSFAADEVPVFLAWRTGREGVKLSDLTREEVDSISGYIAEVMLAAEGDPGRAAGVIWGQYQNSGDGGQ